MMIKDFYSFLLFCLILEIILGTFIRYLRLWQTANLKHFVMKCPSHTIHQKHLKCYTKIVCKTTETLSLMHNSSMPQSLQVHVRRWQLVDNLQQAGEIRNLQQVGDVYGCL